MLFGAISLSAYFIRVQYATIDDVQGAFYDLIGSIKVGHLRRFHYTT